MTFPASLGALAIVAASWGTVAQALTLAEAATPAETPPETYAQDVYIDSRGCVYVRASIGTTVNWVPRLSRDRKTVVCGVAPSEVLPEVLPEAVAGAAAGNTATPPAPPAPPAAVVPAAGVPAAVVPARVVPAAVAAAAVPEAVAAAARSAGPPVAAGTSTVARSIRVDCPADGSRVRVRIGRDTVRVSCPPGLSRTTAHVVTLSDGHRARLVVHPAAVARPVKIPAGYRPAWEDDRLNPYRGPRTAQGDAQMALVLDTTRVPMPAAETVSLRTAAAKPTPGPRFVQVGAFGVPANATRAQANLRGLGFGVATARTRSGLTLVLAGPFASPADLARALRTLRGHYPDAYPRG